MRIDDKHPRQPIDKPRDEHQIRTLGDGSIFGVMIESHLKAGRQDLLPGKDLEYGVSITDACVGWEESRALLDVLGDAVRQRRLKAELDAEAE